MTKTKRIYGKMTIGKSNNSIRNRTLAKPKQIGFLFRVVHFIDDLDSEELTTSSVPTAPTDGETAVPQIVALEVNLVLLEEGALSGWICARCCGGRVGRRARCG